MKKDELKKVLKPLIKECIKEAIFEEGVLSGLIKEVAVGLGSPNTIVESKAQESQKEVDFSRQRSIELQKEAKLQLEQRKRDLENTLGGSFSGIFENLEPMSGTGSPSSDSSSKSPLSNYASNDAGVDISGLMALGGGQNWKKMI